jgi:hypothetical protein
MRVLKFLWLAALLAAAHACSTRPAYLQIGLLGVNPFPESSLALTVLAPEASHLLVAALERQHVRPVSWAFCGGREGLPCTDSLPVPHFVVFAGIGVEADSSLLLVVWAWRRQQQGVLFRADTPVTRQTLPRTLDSIAVSLAKALRQSD